MREALPELNQTRRVVVAAGAPGSWIAVCKRSDRRRFSRRRRGRIRPVGGFWAHNGTGSLPLSSRRSRRRAGAVGAAPASGARAGAAAGVSGAASAVGRACRCSERA